MTRFLQLGVGSKPPTLSQMDQKSLSIPRSSIHEDQFAFDKDEDQITLTGYNIHGSSIQVIQPEIINALQALPIEPEVISRACGVFYRSNNDSKIKSIKGSRKIRRMFYCVLMAYNELDYPVDPSYAADIVGLPRTDIEQAMNECSPSEVILIEPVKMLKFYIHRFNVLLSQVGIRYDPDIVIKEVTSVIRICESTQSGKEWIQNTAAKIVTITAIYFYLNDIKGFDVSKHMQIFEQACYLSWACIRRYHEQIIKYYNLEEPVSSPKNKFMIPFL